MFSLIHFTVTDTEYELPPCVLERYISNPDVEHHNSYATFLIDGELIDCYTACITTKSYAEAQSGFMSNDATALVPVDGTDIYYTNIRLASLIGPGFDQRIVNRFVKQALRGEDLAANIGTQIYGFLDVKDAVSGLTAMIHSDARDWEKVYNLGPKGGYTIEQIAQVVCQLSKFYCERSIKYSVKRTDEHSNSMIDSRLFYRNFKWEPKIKITESTEEILKKRLKRES